ncbi:hypothetical protein GCM10012320_34350 [Sinomonas cellulolyticus]|nr:hypothetical protein GCM10012320_34350 [Sinomonas sp. KCTC 49339]
MEHLVGFRVAGVRELDHRSLEVLGERTLPALLSTLTAAGEGTSLAFSFASDGAGAARVGVECAGARAVELGEAVVRLLTPLALLAEGDVPKGGVPARWALGPIVRATGAGFVPQEAVRPVDVGEVGMPAPRFRDVVEAVLGSPGRTVRVTLEARPGVRGEVVPLFTVKATAAAADYAGEAPPLDIAAVLDRAIPGCRLLPGDGSVVLRYGDAVRLPLLPLDGTGTIAGMDTAPAAPVPVRHRPGSVRPAAGVLLGSAVSFSGQAEPVLLGEEEQLRHVHVTGRTGTGKSTLLTGMAVSAAEAGQGMLVLDPHGALVDRIAGELPEDALGRASLIRAGNLDRPVPVNPLAVADPVRRDMAVADILAAFATIFDPGSTGIVGPRFEQMVGMCLRTLVEFRGPRAGLLEVPRLLTDRAFQHRARRGLTDPALARFWENQDAAARSNEYGDVVAWVTSKWERFTNTAALRAVLGSGEDSLDLEGAMDAGRIVLVDLSKGAVGGPAAQLLGFVYMTRAWTAAQAKTRTRPFTVMVDEAQSFMAGALPEMLSEGRKFGLSVVLAHQYLGQLPAELSRALAGNTATQVAFRAGRADAEALHHRMGAVVAAEGYTTLPDLSALLQRTAGPTTAHPHTLTVAHGRTQRGPDGLRALEESTHQALGRSAGGIPDDPEDEAPGQLPPPRPGQRPPQRPAPAGSGSSFLDEWLARRKAQAAAFEGSGASADEEGRA